MERQLKKTAHKLNRLIYVNCIGIIISFILFILILIFPYDLIPYSNRKFFLDIIIVGIFDPTATTICQFILYLYSIFSIFFCNIKLYNKLLRSSKNAVRLRKYVFSFGIVGFSILLFTFWVLPFKLDLYLYGNHILSISGKISHNFIILFHISSIIGIICISVLYFYFQIYGDIINIPIEELEKKLKEREEKNKQKQEEKIINIKLKRMSPEERELVSIVEAKSFLGEGEEYIDEIRLNKENISLIFTNDRLIYVEKSLMGFHIDKIEVYWYTDIHAIELYYPKYRIFGFPRFSLIIQSRSKKLKIKYKSDYIVEVLKIIKILEERVLKELRGVR
ncbi:MAG: hypothetical protein ACTSRG_17580 [Candidatus Helarchaeota archaeon]